MKKNYQTRILLTSGGGGGGSLLQQTKNCLRTKFKALIIFQANRWKMCRVFNYCTKFQTICFSLSPLTIHANLQFFLKISYLHA
jgi:hypothetical protein